MVVGEIFTKSNDTVYVGKIYRRYGKQGRFASLLLGARISTYYQEDYKAFYVIPVDQSHSIKKFPLSDSESGLKRSTDHCPAIKALSSSFLIVPR